MKNKYFSAFYCACCIILFLSQIEAQYFPTKLISANYFTDNLTVRENEYKKVSFRNPAVLSFKNGCYFSNLNTKKFSKEIPLHQRISFCKALESVSDKLNSNQWSPELKSELLAIWNVFLEQDVSIKPMKKGMSSRIFAAAQAFPEKKSGFNAALHLRPGVAGKKLFFLTSIHELKHIKDYYSVWKQKQSITELELEKRAFLMMAKVARETPEKESFKRLPKLWDEKWAKFSQKKIDEKIAENIDKYMRKSLFYKHLTKNPDRYVYGYTSNTAVVNPAKQIKTTSGDALPYLVKTKQTKKEIAQNIDRVSFTLAKPANRQDAAALLKAALENEKKLYYEMDNFIYNESLDLNCWKKKKIKERFVRTRQIARTHQGQALFKSEKLSFISKKKRTAPECVLDLRSIDTDATETFWSAPYLDEMPVKFNYFTQLDGIKVARYTVYKPSKAKFAAVAAKYPFINPFRVFFGTIFVSMDDAQIIKFWGSSFPNSTTTGQAKKGILASYNATAVRRKLESGIWVTTLLNTVAVANKKGKMKPFSYIVKYENYRQGTSDVLILDDEETVAVLN